MICSVLPYEVFIMNLLDLNNDALGIILKWVYFYNHGVGIKILLLCKRTYYIALKYSFPPWENDGRGLLHACRFDHHEYYIKWATVAGDRWDPNLYKTLRTSIEWGSMNMVKILFDDPILKVSDGSILNDIELSAEIKNPTVMDLIIQHTTFKINHTLHCEVLLSVLKRSHHAEFYHCVLLYAGLIDDMDKFLARIDSDDETNEPDIVPIAPESNRNSIIQTEGAINLDL